MKQDYKSKTKEQLKEILQDLNLKLARGRIYTKRLGVFPKRTENPKLVKTIKKEIARIKTELKKRKNENIK